MKNAIWDVYEQEFMALHNNYSLLADQFHTFQSCKYVFTWKEKRRKEEWMKKSMFTNETKSQTNNIDRATNNKNRNNNK